MGPGAIHVQLPERPFNDPEWDASSLNPKNRTDRASLLDSPSWEIFGADLLEQIFYILPKLAVQSPPVRIDVYIASEIDQDDYLCKPLHGGLPSLMQATAV